MCNSQTEVTSPFTQCLYNNGTSTSVITKENKLINKVKKLNTEKLDEWDLDIIREKKVSGRAFIKLTEDKLEEWGMADESILAIVDFVEVKSVVSTFHASSTLSLKITEVLFHY